MEDITTLGDLAGALRQMRVAAGMTQAEMARAAGISRQRLSEIESGAATNFEAQTMLRLLRATGNSLSVVPEGRPTLGQILKEREKERLNGTKAHPSASKLPSRNRKT